ncbi:hypothetical protein CPB97_010832 [Podila verticillata]|nr:hypothetical protein CPB97_010832 [Podila verticillata]
MLRHSAILLPSAARVSKSSLSPLFRNSTRLQASSSSSTSLSLQAIRSLHASTWSPFAVPVEQQEQHEDLPTIQIAKDSASVTISPLNGSKY